MPGRLRWLLLVLLLLGTDALIFFAGGQAAFVQRPIGVAYLALWNAWAIAVGVNRKRGKRGRNEEPGWVRVVFGIAGYGVLAGLGPWEYTHFSGPLPRDSTLGWVGMAMFACGTVVNAAAMRALRGYFTIGLGATPGHRLVTAGPYRIVRHPGYCSYPACLAGMGLALSSLAVLGLLPTVLGYMMWRIPREEEGLAVEFGEAYTRYRTRTRWRLFPGLY